jgi:hypothetical protein
MKNSNRVWAVLCAATAAMALTATAAAATPGAQIDQSSSSTANTTNALISQAHASSASQTFTAGVSGDLTDVTVAVHNDAFLGSNGDLRVAINPVDGLGAPNTAVELAVGTVSVATLSSGAPAWADFVFGSPATLTAGTSYAITLTEINGNHEHIWWAGSSGDTYAGGEPFGASGGDFAFETYMIAAASSGAAEDGRRGYCSIAGNTWQNGSPIPAGTFLDLVDGQPATGHYKGATVAYFLEGLGITCVVPSGYARTDESVGYYGHGDPGSYAYYGKTG